jgi:hypothetical protein
MLRTLTSALTTWRAITAITAALLASMTCSLAFALPASATDENYNCFTNHPEFTCPVATGAYNYITNDYGISYTHSGICVDTVQSTGKIWKRTCTSGNESLTCNGNEYEIFGYGETVATEGPTKQNLAGTQNNYHYCTRK